MRDGKYIFRIFYLATKSDLKLTLSGNACRPETRRSTRAA